MRLYIITIAASALIGALLGLSVVRDTRNAALLERAVWALERMADAEERQAQR